MVNFWYLNVNGYRPTAANQEELEELQLQLHEIRAMYQATEVERDRLSELVSVLEKRFGTTYCN